MTDTGPQEPPSALSGETRHLLDAVRVGLGLDPSGTDAPVSLGLVRRAARQGVAAPVVAAARMLGTADEETARTVADLSRSQALGGLRALVTTRQLVELFDRAGIPVLVVKGVALGAQTGREPAERHGVDVDLLVRPDDLLAADQVLAAAGYRANERTCPPLGDDQRSRFLRWSAYERSYSRQGAHADLHWRLTPGHLPGLAAEAVMDDAVTVDVGGTPVATLDPDAALAHTVLHGAKDYWLSLRSTVDAHLLVTVAGAGWERARELAADSPAIAEARLGVEVLCGATDLVADRASRPRRPLAQPTPRRRWLDGIEGRAELPVGGGPPPDGWVPYLRRRCSVTPGVASTAAIVANLLVTPDSLARSQARPSLWWVDALAQRPRRILTRARRRGERS
ncbi:MAG: nucleotidyltransferase family protein [Acidimicrobiales bacterium]|nr:nucleotidyltransferase family protein [Acidimicrobiales bacterium]